ncbi:alpha/beta-hydrolase [Obba rivulosa]|uniref:Alpha/beta-hydrolase n=1 Tax=Obba rivulosa TaxID=1052685 RepID=A0A8E2DK52_9APHY|nr:alpha/beta-hydrolase [Obba rivulosa]
MYSSILPSVLLILTLSSLSSSKDVAPTVRLDDGTFIGATDGVTDSFLGIPFVKPPIGPLRFEVPQQHTQYDGTYNATTFGFSCPGLGTGMPNVTNELQDLLDSVQERQTPIDEDWKIANIPFVNGNCDDEGTEFTFQSNITTEEEVSLTLESGLLPGVSASSVEEVLSLYPADPAAGSPFGTGDANAITPQYKRVAAILGDLNFQGPRRFMMQQLSGRQSTWSFLSKRFKSLPIIGSGHETDIVIVYGPGDLTDYVINFVNHLDPNNKTGIHWPQYTIEEPRLLTLWDGPEPRNITNDTYRAEGISLLTQLGQEHPVAV